jgi:hypothetical protein
MLSKFFWTQEFKELVEKYKAEGTLNYNVIKNLDKVCWLFLISTNLLALAMAHSFTNNDVKKFAIFILLSGVAFILCRFYVHFYINERVISYTIGQKKEAYKFEKNSRVYGHNIFFMELFSITYEYNKKKYGFMWMTNIEFEEMINQKEYAVMINPRMDSVNIPYLESWQIKYNLKWEK